MYKNQKCLHTDRPTNQQTHIWKSRAPMELKINFDTLCSLSLGWIVHKNSHAKSCSLSSSKMAELWITLYSFVICWVSIWTSMQNLKSVAQKMSGLWYFCTVYFVIWLDMYIWTSMQNLESLAQKMAELWVLCTSFCTFVIYLDYPYKLPCKSWSL